jgi:hypothetical protein
MNELNMVIDEGNSLLTELSKGVSFSNTNPRRMYHVHVLAELSRGVSFRDSQTITNN